MSVLARGSSETYDIKLSILAAKLLFVNLVPLCGYFSNNRRLLDKAAINRSAESG
jgi:hypothetical protein